jgi:hypothetical protein
MSINSDLGRLSALAALEKRGYIEKEAIMGLLGGGLGALGGGSGLGALKKLFASQQQRQPAGLGLGRQQGGMQEAWNRQEREQTRPGGGSWMSRLIGGLGGALGGGMGGALGGLAGRGLGNQAFQAVHRFQDPRMWQKMIQKGIAPAQQAMTAMGNAANQIPGQVANAGQQAMQAAGANAGQQAMQTASQIPGQAANATGTGMGQAANAGQPAAPSQELLPPAQLPSPGVTTGPNPPLPQHTDQRTNSGGRAAGSFLPR